MHQRNILAHAQQFLLRPNHLVAHPRSLVGSLEHLVKMLLILLAQIQRPAETGKNLGRHSELFPIFKAGYRSQVFPRLLKLTDDFTGTMHKRIGKLRVDIRCAFGNPLVYRQGSFGCQGTDLAIDHQGEFFIAFKVKQRCLQQALVLHRLVTAQVKQAVLVNIDFYAWCTVTVQRLLEPGFGKLGDALQVFQSTRQCLIGLATARLAASQCLTQP